MSWQATAWAKRTRGHRSNGTKLVLQILADYHNWELGMAWPSQATLSDDCEMPLRTIQWCLKALGALGFITVLQKGNQHKPSRYRLNFEMVAASKSFEPAISGEPASIAYTQDGASEPAISIHTSKQEEIIKEEEEAIGTPQKLMFFDEQDRAPLNYTVITGQRKKR